MATVDGRAVGERPQGFRQWAWTIAVLVAGVLGVPVLVLSAATLPGTIREVRDYRDAPVCLTAETRDCRRMIPVTVVDLDTQGFKNNRKRYYARFAGHDAPTGRVKITKSAHNATAPGRTVVLEKWHGDITAIQTGDRLWELDAAPSDNDDFHVASCLSLVLLAPLWLIVGVRKVRGRGTFGSKSAGDRPRQAMHAASAVGVLTFAAAFLSFGLPGITATWAVSLALAAIVLFLRWRTDLADAAG